MILVPDGSIAVELFAGTEVGARASALFRPNQLVAPELVDAEVLSGIRKLVLAGVLSVRRAKGALDELHRWPVKRVPHRPFVSAAFELRHALSAYDALYVAVAAAVGGTLVTIDRRLARAPVRGVRILDLTDP